METKITTKNSQVTVKEGQIIIDINDLINKEDAISEISKYQQEMREELDVLDETEENKLLANLIHGHINASANIMKIISKL